MTGWSVDLFEDADGEWWAFVVLVGTLEAIEDGPYATREAALNAGNKAAYDHWVEVREPRG